MALHDLLVRSAARHPDRIAVREPSGAAMSYRELEAFSDRLRDRLAAMGVGRGDRVGLHLHKSIDAVAAIVGILKCGATYVPVDPTAPATRNGYMAEYEVERELRDANASRIYSGTSEIQRMIIAPPLGL